MFLLLVTIYEEINIANWCALLLPWRFDEQFNCEPFNMLPNTMLFREACNLWCWCSLIWFMYIPCWWFYQITTFWCRINPGWNKLDFIVISIQLHVIYWKHLSAIDWKSIFWLDYFHTTKRANNWHTKQFRFYLCQ